MNASEFFGMTVDAARDLAIEARTRQQEVKRYIEECKGSLRQLEKLIRKAEKECIALGELAEKIEEVFQVPPAKNSVPSGCQDNHIPF